MTVSFMYPRPKRPLVPPACSQIKATTDTYKTARATRENRAAKNCAREAKTASRPKYPRNCDFQLWRGTMGLGKGCYGSLADHILAQSLHVISDNAER